MANPLLPAQYPGGPPRRRPSDSRLRRVAVDVPSGRATNDAIFLVLRRMRVPMILLVTIFGIAVTGLSVIPGVDGDGHARRMTVFESFYLFSYTATTIGFGEIPYALTTQQRMWVTLCIYLTVIGWAYAIGALFALLQDHGFREALAMQSFARRVRRLNEPFLILAGFGQMGKAVAESLDDLGRRCVVLDMDAARLELLAGQQYTLEVPGLEADARDPAMLALAGLGSRYCEGVVALTENDEVNLAIVMAVQLLRPEVPVISRSNDRTHVDAMREFAAEAVINPYDRYGAYLLLLLHAPITHQLVTWLLAPWGTPLPRRVEGLDRGRWIIAADGRFGREVLSDLTSVGLDATLVKPKIGRVDVSGAIGFVAGSDDDSLNLSMAAHARLTKPDIFVSIRQHSQQNEPLLRAFAPDSVFVPAQLTTQEALARVITPAFWEFIEYALTQGDAWSATLLDRIVERCGEISPDQHRTVLDADHAPAAVRWMEKHTLVVGDLYRDHDDRDLALAAVPVMVVRGLERIMVPPDDLPLAEGDIIISMGHQGAFDSMGFTLFHDHVIEYVVTGDDVPSTWIWGFLSGLTKKRSRSSAAA